MSPSVLLVEDDPQVRVVLDAMLQDQGLDVWSVGDDLSAFQVLSQEAKHICVLLTDINLGSGSNGFEVARRARSLNSDMTVIFISGYPVAPGQPAAEGGVLMTKPLDFEALIDMVAAAAKPVH